MTVRLYNRLLILLLVLLLPAQLAARPRASVKNILQREENPQGHRSRLILPYAFSTEDLGLTLGIGGGMKGYGQEQLIFGATGFASFEEAGGGFLGMWDYRPFADGRLFFSAQVMAGHYPNQHAYSALSFAPDVPRPGSNESEPEDAATSSGYDNWSDFQLEYILPLGAARDDALQHFRLEGGLLRSAPSGGPPWNPLRSGVTSILLRQYNRYVSFERDEGDIHVTVHPVELAVSYNNTDFPANPSTGCSQYLGITHDFGWLESPDDWTFIEFEASRYFSLGGSETAKQRIIALNLWTGTTPTWKEETLENGRIEVSHRPPYYEGARLGGFYRMRAYPMNRFNDRAVLYAAAEYRYTLKWNPVGAVDWLRFLQSDWLQLVGFVEGGRVARDFDGDLLKDWKVDAGFGIRSMFAGTVVRLDIGFSDETASAWVMFGHPF